MPSSTLLIGKMKSSENSFIMFTVRPTNTVRAAFSKSVSWMSIGLNSTRHPISVVSSVGGGLNLSEFQFVDCKFSKWEFPSMGGIFVHQPVVTAGRTSSNSKSESLSHFLSSEFQYPPLLFLSSSTPLIEFLVGLHPGPKFSSCS